MSLKGITALPMIDLAAIFRFYEKPCKDQK
jgi:hypothetical protein